MAPFEVTLAPFEAAMAPPRELAEFVGSILAFPVPLTAPSDIKASDAAFSGDNPAFLPISGAERVPDLMVEGGEAGERDRRSELGEPARSDTGL